MTSPFDSKNRVAAALDRLALRVLLFVLSVGYFFFLWHSGALSLLAGSALFILAMLTLLLLERRTLARRDHALRVRVGSERHFPAGAFARWRSLRPSRGAICSSRFC